MWDLLFRKLYKVLKLERIGLVHPQTQVERILTKEGLNREGSVSTVDPDIIRKYTGYNGQNGYSEYNGYNGHPEHNGGVVKKGKTKDFQQLQKYNGLQLSRLSLPGNNIATCR